VTSTRKLGPVVLGLKHRILRASVASHENSFTSTRVRSPKLLRAVTLPHEHTRGKLKQINEILQLGLFDGE
jgi:hypothetical protein